MGIWHLCRIVFGLGKWCLTGSLLNGCLKMMFQKFVIGLSACFGTATSLVCSECRASVYVSFEELGNTVSKETTNSIDLKFQIIQLKKAYIASEANKCLAKLDKKGKVVTGFSVLYVSGTWTSNTLNTALYNFELKAGLKDKLSTEAKLEYEKSKERVLSGNFKPFSIIIAEAYKEKGSR